MKILSLQGKNFKIYNEFHLDLKAQCIGIVGSNGTGKTTILDAIHYLGITKSFLQSADKDCIKHGESYFHLQATIQPDVEDIPHHLSIYVDQQKGKKIKVNDKWIQRFSDHIGFLPVVLISPADINIVSQSAEFRRKYIDAFIAQFNPTYLESLISYHKILSQRNALLKQHHLPYFEQQIDFFDESLAQISHEIYHTRREFIHQINHNLNNIHYQLTNIEAIVEIKYDSSLSQENFLDQLRKNRSRDIALGFTEKGIHRDEYHFLLDGYPLRKFGSQGQQKSFLLALKICQYEETYKRLNKKPIFLIDDIADKLDEQRMNQFFSLLNQLNIEQLLITDTNAPRLQLQLSLFSTYKIYSLEKPGLIVALT